MYFYKWHLTTIHDIVPDKNVNLYKMFVVHVYCNVIFPFHIPGTLVPSSLLPDRQLVAAPQTPRPAEEVRPLTLPVYLRHWSAQVPAGRATP